MGPVSANAEVAARSPYLGSDKFVTSPYNSSREVTAKNPGKYCCWKSALNTSDVGWVDTSGLDVHEYFTSINLWFRTIANEQTSMGPCC